MKEGIGIFVYSFQNKDLIDNITDMVNKSSGKHNLSFYIIDQNNVERSRLFDIDAKHVHIIYKHTKWDLIKSPVYHKFDGSRILISEYFMQCGDGLKMSQNWDSSLIEKIQSVRYKNQTVISGNHKVDLANKNLFMIKKNKSYSEDYSNVNIIDRDFIFCLSSDIKRLGYPIHLKYYGEEEEMTMRVRKNHYDLICAPTDLFNNATVPLEDYEYIPFSLTHGYTKFVEENKKSIADIFGINLIPLPFDDSDVAYTIDKSETDKIGGERYLNKTRIIN
jgi:hypothetical protein